MLRPGSNGYSAGGVHVVGESFGGVVATTFARRHPPSVGIYWRACVHVCMYVWVYAVGVVMLQCYSCLNAFWLEETIVRGGSFLFHAHIIFHILPL